MRNEKSSKRPGTQVEADVRQTGGVYFEIIWPEGYPPRVRAIRIEPGGVEKSMPIAESSMLFNRITGFYLENQARLAATEEKVALQMVQGQRIIQA